MWDILETPHGVGLLLSTFDWKSFPTQGLVMQSFVAIRKKRRGKNIAGKGGRGGRKGGRGGRKGGRSYLVWRR